MRLLRFETIESAFFQRSGRVGHYFDVETIVAVGSLRKRERLSPTNRFALRFASDGCA